MLAFAHGDMGLKGLGEAALLVLGIAALVLSAVLGALSWLTVLRPPSRVGWIFGRGFLGISAIVAFLIGSLGVSIGAELWLAHTPDWVLVLIVTLVMLFLAIEFFIAATLYRRSNAQRASLAAKLLSGISYALAGLCALGAGLFAGLGILIAVMGS